MPGWVTGLSWIQLTICWCCFLYIWHTLRQLRLDFFVNRGSLHCMEVLFFAWHRNYIIPEKFLMSCSFCNNNHLVSHLYHLYTFSALFGDYKSRFHQKNSGAKGIRCKKRVIVYSQMYHNKAEKQLFTPISVFSPKFLSSTTSLWNLVKNSNSYILAVRLQEHL